MRPLVAALAGVLALTGTSAAQTITTQQADEILKELRAIRLKRDDIDTGKVRFISRDFPLDFHPQARPAARASRCAGDQGKFWELRTALVKNADRLTPAFMSQQATALALDMTQFDTCMKGTGNDSAIDRDVAEATGFAVSGTPTFFVGKTTAQGFEGSRIVGAQPYAVFQARIDGLLK